MVEVKRDGKAWLVVKGHSIIAVFDSMANALWFVAMGGHK